MPSRSMLPPGPRGLPVLGSIPQFRRDPLSFVSGVQRAYGDVATVRILNSDRVLFSKPEHAYYFLVDHARNFSSGSGRFIMKRFLGEALLTTDGDIHRQQRRLIQPAFHKKRVEGYAEIMTRQTLEMLDTWHPGDELNLASALQELTLRIVVKALFNLDLQTQSSELSHLFTTVIESQSPGLVSTLPIELLDLPFMPTHRALQARRELDTFVYDLIARRRTAGGDEGDVLSMLLETRDEDGTGMTDRELRDQAMTLIAAGHETTSNALAWTFYLLSQNTAQYDLLREELDRELGGRTPTAADMPNLGYLDWVITESMRIYPPAWMLNRTALEPFELEGYSFPAGTRVILSQWVIHHLADVWGDPEAFRPERWDPANAQKLPRGAYFPFGAGPRICIGMPLADMEARLVLATILQHYTPRMVPGWPVEAFPRVTLRMKHGIGVKLEPASVPASVPAAG
ncbi:MAG TPA: cytochrome P450 [Ktedonobacterales bacterium]|nr:cytochrome P450 [Ktedonobacterales bacterium]